MSGQDAIYRAATQQDLLQLWDRNIARHPGDGRWLRWRDEYIGYNRDGRGITFAVAIGGEAVGEGTLLLSPSCGAVGGRLQLANGNDTANINALRIEKEHEGRGHISALMQVIERCAAQYHGILTLTIGVEEKELRSRAIYEHFGYTELLFAEPEEGETVLYYAKRLK